MWILTNKGIISVVADRHDPGRLLVRSRNKAFLQEVVEPLGHEVAEDQSADYPYRLFMSRRQFEEVVTQEAAKIDYPNFKDSVVDPVLHGLYSKVWGILSVLGMGRRYGRAIQEPWLQATDDEPPIHDFGFRHEDWGAEDRPVVRRRGRKS